MSFEVILTICNNCNHAFGKRICESRGRRESRKFCSLVCSRTYFKAHEQAWWSHGSITINKDKKESIDDIAPRIWSDQEFIDFDKNYPELSAFT